MPCYHPLTAYRSKQGRGENKKWPVTFNRRDGYSDQVVQLPCGQCIGCRLERSRQWAIRCIHEASLHSDNCFITLTYNAENETIGLVKRDFVTFMKRLRKHFYRKEFKFQKIRYFHCGEYGEDFGRPHHHACLFGVDFEDKTPWKNAESGNTLFISETLHKIWPYGYAYIGKVTWESAAYVARYILKKMTGQNAEAYYDNREPEYVTMSRRPGIGKAWWDKYKNDVLAFDKCIVKQSAGMVECKPPRFYDSQLEKENNKLMERIKFRRQKEAKNNKHNVTERLTIRENIKLLKIKKLIRNYEIQPSTQCEKKPQKNNIHKHLTKRNLSNEKKALLN